MQFIQTTLPEVLLVKPRVFGDDRGYFFESWHERKFIDAGLDARFVQSNHSHSVRHTLRGLHYQISKPQGKLVRVTKGAVFDVAVDIRRSSPRFGQWVGVELNDRNHDMLWVPPGFAHGYLALSDEIDFLYQCTEFYAPEHERSVRWDDRSISIRWPLPDEADPILSAKDAKALSLDDAEVFA